MYPRLKTNTTKDEKDIIIEELLYENLQLKKLVKTLTKRTAELEKRLSIYENPHTPPSNQILKKNKKKDTPLKKRGAPKGHKGTTRKKLKPDETINVFTEKCPQCNADLEEPIRIEKKIIEEIQPQPKIEVKQYNIAEYCCSKCGLKFKSKHENCPQVGIFGPNLMTRITLLKFQLRGVLRKIVDFLKSNDSFEITPAGILTILLRVGKACKKEYVKIWERIVKSKYRYGDETGMKVCGEKWWLWIFRTLQDILVVIRPSRGKKVTNEIFGENPKGCIVADGWKLYRVFESLQRCWAHLLREVDTHVESSNNGKELSEILHRKFKKLKEFQTSNHSMEDRVCQKEIWDREIEELVEKFSTFNQIKKPVTYLKNGLGFWYTCLLYPGMEPTNNLSEQAIREHVIVRKIIGSFRSKKGAEYYQYIASMFATWKILKKDIFEELSNLLKREICLGELNFA